MKGKITISPELCKGCSYCSDACPEGVIVISKRFNRSGYFPAIARHLEKCTGCTICARMCPEIAIEVYRNNKQQARK